MSIGTRLALSARLGNSMTPRLCVVTPRQGPMNLQQVSLVTSLFVNDHDVTPIPGLNFEVTQLPDAPDGSPRFRVGLGKDVVEALVQYARVPSSLSQVARDQRVVYYTWSLSLSANDVRPVRFGPLIIKLGATGG